MINLTCTNCRATLSIDDAFAGGVCRCRHCGTIQTVPSRLKSGASPKPAKVDPAGSGSRALYQHGSSTGSGTGLDDLAEIVASSGLLGSGSGLSSSRLRGGMKQSAGAKRSPRSLAPWLVAAGLVIVALLAVVLWMSIRSPRASPIAPAGSDHAGAVEVPAEAPPAGPVPGASPNFCGMPVDGAIVIYVLDRGNGTRELFDSLKEATYKSIESLGADRKFQVIFWNNGQDDAYPAGLPAYATSQNVSACRRAMEDISAFGQTDAAAALSKAFKNHADIVVIATGKALELESTFADTVMTARGSSNAVIDTIALGDSSSPVLHDIANRTHGTYKTLSASALRSFGE